MPIPENTGVIDVYTGKILPKNLGTWANLISTREITISSIATGASVGNIIVGNVSFGNLTIVNSRITANSNVITLTTTTANIANISVGMRVYSANIAGNTTVTSIRNSSTGSTWDTWHAWINNPAGYFLYTTDIINHGKNLIYNCQIAADAEGIITYDIRTTANGSFDGSETLTTISNGNIAIPAFQGQFLAITANVVSTGSLASLTSLEVTVSDQTLALAKNKVDTTTLSGNINSRQLDLGRTLSYITNLQITPYLVQSGGIYITADYVTDGYFVSATAILGAFPQIVDKTAGSANIALVDNNGNYIDGYVDIYCQALPEQYIIGNNLLQR